MSSTPHHLTRLVLAAGGLLVAPVLSAQSRTICPEYAEPVRARAARPPGREHFRPDFERNTRQGAALVQSVDRLFAEAWERGTVRPRNIMNDLAFLATVHVNDARNAVHGERWAERVTEAQIARAEHIRDRLREIARGERSWRDLVLDLRHVSLRVLLACPETLRGRRVSVLGDVTWEPGAPEDALRLRLEDGGLRVPLVWPIRRTIGGIPSVLYGRGGGIHSWWDVSIERANGGYAVHLHEMFGLTAPTR